jgi:hypothetical protein
MEVLLAAIGVALVGAAVWAAVSGLRRWLEARLGATDAELRRLGDAGLVGDRGVERVWAEVSGFRAALGELRAREEERRAREEQAWATLQRLAAVLAGGQGAGRAGENVLRESLGALPPSMVEADFRVNGRVVEWALILPDGRRLPVDSKWPADRELQALAGATDPTERDRLARTVERAVAERTREVAGYLDPALTAPVAVAAVPDAAYRVLRRAHVEAYRRGVVVVPYSIALPVLLSLHALVARFGSGGDVERCLAGLASVLDALAGIVENRVAKASTMLGNATEELRGQLGKARALLARSGLPEPGRADGEGAPGTASPPPVEDAERGAGGSASLRVAEVG